MSRLKIPNGANELSYNIFIKQKTLFYDHTLTIYSSQFVKVMSRLKIPNGANELSYTIFIKQNNYFMIIPLPYIRHNLLK